MTKKPMRQDDGYYHINGNKYKLLTGSRHQVWNGTAYRTEGLLVKKDLIMNKHGRIVSKKKHVTAKKEKRLQRHGYFAEPGKFGYVIGTPLGKRRTNKRKTMKDEMS